MEKTGVNRVNYFPRQILRTQDFVDEQTYHLEARRRHNIGHHLWGIVNGLELKTDKDGAAIVTPGFAVDGFGRELVLPAGRKVPPDAFDDTLAESIDVWIVYARTAGDRGDPAYQPCVPERDRTNYRWTEIAAIEWTRAGAPLLLDPRLGMPERRQPPGVAASDLDFDPTRVAPDDPVVRWPVFLGRVDRITTGGETTYTVDLDGRPYAGARAETITTPDGGASLQIGKAADDPTRFALLLKDESQTPPQLVPRLTLDADEQWEIRGAATVRGDVTVDGGGLQFGAGAPYGAEKPWRVYRVQFDDGDGQRREELRIEMRAQDDAAKNEVAIGVFKQGEFKPCLTVGADGTVTVHGDLIVKGKIPNVQKAALSEQTRAIAASVFTGGLMQSLNLAIGSGGGEREAPGSGPARPLRKKRAAGESGSNSGG